MDIRHEKKPGHRYGFGFVTHSVRLRMRAVTGSSAVDCFWPDALRRGLDGVGGLERLDPLGQFGNARPFFVAWLMGRGGKAGLELVTQGWSVRTGRRRAANGLPRRAW